MLLRPLADTDLAALVAIQHATAGSSAAWSEATLARQLRDHGRHVVVAEQGGVRGVAAWLVADGAWFGSPVLAADAETAGVLVAELVARARAGGARSLRIGCADGELHKRAALIARGFVARLAFVTLASPPAPRPGARLAGLRRVAVTDVAVAVYRDLHDETFAGLDNAAPLALDAASALQGAAWPDGSGVWLDGDEPAAFLQLIRDREPIDHVLIDAIGVRAAWRRRGIARALVDHAIDAAARAGAAEVRANIASTNGPSLALHRAAGLREASRREMFELATSEA